MAKLLLAAHLKELREFYKYTQDYVSKQLNIERPSYSNYEREIRTPPLELVVEFAEFYNITVDDLLINAEFSPSAAALDAACQHLTPDEKILLCQYRILSEAKRKDVLNYINFRNTPPVFD